MTNYSTMTTRELRGLRSDFERYLRGTSTPAHWAAQLALVNRELARRGIGYVA